MSVEEAARSAQVKGERLRRWEDPEDALVPTIRQARTLANVYGLTVFELLAPEIPDVPSVKLVPDYRFHRERPSARERRCLEGIQSWAEECRLNALDLLDALGEEPRSWAPGLQASLSDDVEARAIEARAAIKVPLAEQQALKGNDLRLLPNILRRGISRLGILVLYHSALGKLRTRGLCLSADPMPVIVYGKEAPSAQAFTLCHELGHVLLGRSGISGTPRFGSNVADEEKKVEDWCNRFAAALLIPSAALAERLGAPSEAAASFDDIELGRLARDFSVSRHAMLIRLVNLGYVHAAFYWRVMRPFFIREEEDYQGGGRTTYYGSRYRNSRGDFYTALVLEAWGSGLITSHSAAEFMGITNLAHLRDIRDNWT